LHAAKIGRRRRTGSLALAAWLALVAGRATAQDAQPGSDAELFEALDQAEAPASYPDPFEPANRKVLDANEALDRWIFEPVTRAYRALVPDPAERAVSRVFRNLSEPASAVNHLLQGEPKLAGETLLRFTVNSTAGLGGIVDVAGGREDLPEHHTDFGATLYRYGTPSGPYLVLPVLGPSTARDAVGDLVDRAPQLYLLGGTEQILLGTSNGISLRSEQDQALDALRSSSVDFYAALRAAYYLSRESELGGAPVDGAVGAAGSGPSAILRSSAESSASNPSRSSTAEYSERRSASSDTVPFK